MLWSILFILLGTYIGFGLLLYLMQERMIFLPSREHMAEPRLFGFVEEEIWLETKDGLRLHAWFLPAATEPAQGTVLFCHGNAGNISHRLETALIYHELGLNVLLFDYRGYGKSEGRTSETGIYRDVEAAWAYLVEKRGLEPDSVYIIGRSLGGAPAAFLATKVKPAGLILESVFSSIPDMAMAKYPFYPRFLARLKLPTAEFTAQVESPVMVMHSTEDEIIPYSLGQRVFDAAPQPKRFIQLSGDHNNCYFISPEKYQAAIKNFVEQ